MEIKHILAGLVVAFVVSRSHAFRSIRRFLPIVYLSALVYRFVQYSEGAKSALAVLSELLEFVTSKNAKAQFIVEDFLAIFLLHSLLYTVNKWTSYNLKGFYDLTTNYLFNQAKSLSFVRKQIQKEHTKMEESLEKDLKTKSRSIGKPNKALPAQGWSREEVLKIMTDSLKTEDVIWSKGQLSGAVYHGGLEHQEFLNKCFGMYSLSNPLHADIWPSVMKFDAEIVSMTASLVNNGLESVCGCTSSVSVLDDFQILFMTITIILHVDLCRRAELTASFLRSRLTVISGAITSKSLNLRL